jgi:signal peptidase I
MTQEKVTSSDKTQEKEKPTGLKKLWVEYIKPFLVVALVLTAARSSLLDWNDVPTGSMEPTIITGDRILVNKLAYDLKVPYTTWRIFRWADPKPGEIVVFYSPFKGTRLVKRLVAGPGDKVEIRDGVLMINGKPSTYGALENDISMQMPLNERTKGKYNRENNPNGLNHPVRYLPDRWPGNGTRENFGPVTVPADHYFAMGDNRDNSKDSRFSVEEEGPGFVPKSAIIGRSSRVALSVDPENYYMPRWSRFFKALP